MKSQIKSSEVENVARSINGAIICNVDYTLNAHPSYIRKGATDGSGAVNPLWGRKADIKLVRKNVQINMGIRYTQAVNGRLEKIDATPDFEAGPMMGKVSHENPHKNICVKEKDTSVVYLCYMPMKNANHVTTYELDGKDVTDLMEAFKPVPKAKSESKKQADKGLEGKKQIGYRTLTIANIDTLTITLKGEAAEEVVKAELIEDEKLESSKEAVEATSTETETA
jgi:hypothetical protein